VLRLAFSDDGRALATSSADGKLRLWDLPSRTLVGAPLAGGGGTTFLLPGDRILVGTSTTGTGVLWPVASRAWEARACRVAHRSLTRDEWRAVLPDRSYRAVCP
jgi:WD40 repeat protein